MKRSNPLVKLTNLQLLLIEALKLTSLHRKFYWTGGTLLSHYYLQHRLSLDLDFFTEETFTYEQLIPFLSIIKQKKPDSTIEENKIHDRWDFLIRNSETSRFEFVFYNHNRKRLKPLIKYMGIYIDSLEDIAANKVMAYFDRNEPKDLFDIYFLLKKKFTVKKLLDLTKEKFTVSFSDFMFWSESAKSVQKLSQIKPLLLNANTNKQSKLLKEVQNYFLSRGKKYLRLYLEK